MPGRAVFATTAAHGLVAARVAQAAADRELPDTSVPLFSGPPAPRTEPVDTAQASFGPRRAGATPSATSPSTTPPLAATARPVARVAR